MVTTKFNSSFLEEKVQGEESIDIVREDEDVKAVGEHGDMTSFYGMSEVVNQTTETFNLKVEEAVDFDNQVEEFGGKRRFTDRMKRTAEKYGESYEEELLDQIVDQIRVDQDLSAGNDLWNFLKKPEADLLAENSEEKLEAITESQEENIIANKIEAELEEEYQKAAEEAYRDNKEEFNKLYNLSQISGQEIGLNNFDTFNWIKSKQYDNNWNNDLDLGEISSSLKSEIDTQIRAKTLDALNSQAHKAAAEKYEEVTGTRPNEVNEDIVYSARAWMMTEDEETRNVLEEIMHKGDEAYLSTLNENIADIDYHHIDILKDGAGRKEYQVGDKQVEVYVASPEERLRYGEEFQTCKSLTWEEQGDTNEETIKRSAALKSPIIYAEVPDDNGEDQVVGREIIHYDLDGDHRDLTNGRMYTNLESGEHNQELKEVIDNYKDEIRSDLAVPTEEQKRLIQDAETHYKVTGDWYAPENTPQI